MAIKAFFYVTGSMLALAAAPALAQQAPANPEQQTPAPAVPTEQSQAGTQARPGSQGVATTTNQDTRTDTAAQPGDIVVTANRRQERLNDAPTAVSAFTAEDRTVRGILTTQDIARFTPGVSISDNPNRANIRGIGRVTNALGSDPGVANYVDGFYTSESDVIGSSDFLTERVEILRGPQGTLYGRNSIGGATNIVSKRPTREWMVEGRAFINDYLRIGSGVAVSGPIDDNIRFKIAGIGAVQREGYTRNVSGPDQYTDEIYTLDGQLEFDVTPNLNAWFRVQHTRYDQRPQIATVISTFANVPQFGGLVANPQFGVTNVSQGNPFVVSYDFGGREQLTGNFSAVTNITLDTDDVIVRFIGGTAAYDYLQTRDLDLTARTSYVRNGRTIPTAYVERVGEDKRWRSGELNFLSPPGGDLDWIFGLYYYYESLDQPVDFTIPSLALLERPQSVSPAVPQIVNPRRSYYAQRGRLKSRAMAPFAQFTYRLTPALSFELGVRYSLDQKRGIEDQIQVFYNADVLPTTALGIQNRTRTLREEFEAWSGNVGVKFEPSDDTLAYARYSRGFKSGGFSLGAFAVVPVVGSEYVDAYEVGLKQTVGPLQLNTAAFYYDYRDQQVPVSVQTAPGVVNSVLFNVPKSRSYGFEAEAFIRPVRPLAFNLVYSYLNATFREFSGVVDPSSTNTGFQDLSGDDLPQSPRHRLTLNGVITVGPLDVSLTQSWVGSQYYQVFNEPRFQAPGYRDTQVRLTYTGPDQGYRIIAGVNNAFDNTSYSYITTGALSAGALTSVLPRNPRIFYLEGRFKF